MYRYADAFPAIKVTFSKNEGTRRKRRPPTRWLDDVEKDFKLMGINIWRAIVTDRGPRFRRQKISLGSQKRPYQRFSKVGIGTYSPSLEVVTAARAHFSKNMISVISDELYGREKRLYCASTDTNHHPRFFPTDFSSNQA
ncbi:hypothetical protein TNCV_4941001 [Trichonephila clavipes]|nr:hypothetical protein TNCV_4941001 [Trichonephila clavipes]